MCFHCVSKKFAKSKCKRVPTHILCILSMLDGRFTPAQSHAVSRPRRRPANGRAGTRAGPRGERQPRDIACIFLAFDVLSSDPLDLDSRTPGPGRVGTRLGRVGRRSAQSRLARTSELALEDALHCKLVRTNQTDQRAVGNFILFPENGVAAPDLFSKVP